MEFQNVPAIVTGGASGLGEGAARALAAAGCKVAILDVNKEQGEKVAAELGGIFLHCDVTSADSAEAAVSAAREAHGPCGVAVNCAGIAPAAKILGREGVMPLESFSKVVQVNLIGTFNILRLAAADMAQREPNGDGERGVIINTASVAALGAAPKMSIYAASKHAVLGLTRSAAVEYGKQGVRVNAVCPAVIDTEMFRRAVAIEPRKADAAAAMHPIGRVGRAEEIAAAVLYLCSEGASFTTGIALPVDGGSTCI